MKKKLRLDPATIILVFTLLGVGAGLEETQDIIPSDDIVPVEQTEVGK